MKIMHELSRNRFDPKLNAILNAVKPGSDGETALKMPPSDQMK